MGTEHIDRPADSATEAESASTDAPVPAQATSGSDDAGRVGFAAPVMPVVPSPLAASVAVSAVAIPVVPMQMPSDAEQALQRTADRLSRLHAVTALLAAAPDIATIGETITQALMDAVGAAAAALRVLTEDSAGRPVLRLVHARGYSPELLAPPDVALDAALPMTEAVRHGKAIYLETEADWADAYAAVADHNRDAGFGAAAAIPCANDDVAGVLAVSFPASTPHRFDADDRAMLDAIAGQTAIALGRARLVERVGRQARRSAFLAEASRALSTPLDVGETLSLIARLPVPALADYCVVCQPGRDGFVHRVAFAHVDPDMEEVLDIIERDYPLPGDSDLPLARVLRTQQSVFWPHLRTEDLRIPGTDPRYLELVERLELRSGITIPLVARGRALGAILFTMTGPSGRVFDDDDFATAYAFTERAALALDTMRLLAEAQQMRMAAEVARAQAEIAQAEAEAASRARESFLAMMSHELRTPLNAIGGYAELMEMELRGPVTNEQREDLRRIQRSQVHLLGLIDQVLAYARLGGGSLVYDITDVPIDESMRTVESLIGPQLRAKSLVYQYTPCGPDATVRADAGKLRQIVLNLLSNAVKFTNAGGRISVDCDLDDQRVAIHVRDTGHGIAADKREAIFAPFVQATRTRTTLQEGVGLGLAISRDLARGMGGDLTVDSTLGVGSTFTVTLKRRA